MPPISYARHRFPPAILQHATWFYLRFTLSYRDVEDLLAERGLDVSYETVRRWVLKFGSAFARRLRPGRARPTGHCHLSASAAAGRRGRGGRAGGGGVGGALPPPPAAGPRGADGALAPGRDGGAHRRRAE